MRKFKYILLGLCILLFVSLLCLFLYHPKSSLLSFCWKRKHSETYVKCLAFSSNNLILASGSEDAIVKIWRVKDGKLINTFKAYMQTINVVIFSPNGQNLVLGGDDGIINIWSIERKQLVQSFKLKNRITFLVFSPDGKKMISGIDNIVKSWQVMEGGLVKSEQTFSALQSIYCGAISPDGRIIALGGSNNNVELRIVANGQLWYTLGRHIGSVLSIAFSPNGQLIASGSEYDDIKIWQIKDGKLLHSLKGHQGFLGLGWTSSLVFSPDGQFLISGGADGKIRIWQTQNWQLIEEKQINATILSLSISPSGRFLAIGDNKGFIHLFRLRYRGNQEMGRWSGMFTMPAETWFKR